MQLAIETQRKVLLVMSKPLLQALDLVLPPPLETKGKLGDELVIPTLPMNRKTFTSANAIRQLRYTYLCAKPFATAKAALSALNLFNDFLYNIVKVQWEHLTEEEVADFLMWRVRGTEDIAPAPAPRDPYVMIGSALATLAHIRGTAPFLGLCQKEALYGDSIREIVKRLTTSNGPESVRKTPVPPDAVWRTVDDAMLGEFDLTEAVALGLGLCFFMRVVEITSLALADLQIQQVETREAVLVIFRSFKAAGGENKRSLTTPIRRYCFIPKLVGLVKRFLYSPRKRLPFADMKIQSLLVRVLGLPEILPGETRPLPYSLRAGGATWLFTAGMERSYIQQLGRWRSETSLLYCVLTPTMQATMWSHVPTDGDWKNS